MRQIRDHLEIDETVVLADPAVAYRHILVDLEVVLVDLAICVLEPELVQSLSARDHLVPVRELELARD